MQFKMSTELWVLVICHLSLVICKWTTGNGQLTIAGEENEKIRIK